MTAANRRILRIICQDDRIFYSKDWSYDLVAALEQQVMKLHGGVRGLDLISMTEEAYQRIPATVEASELFTAAKEGKK